RAQGQRRHRDVPPHRPQEPALRRSTGGGGGRGPRRRAREDRALGPDRVAGRRPLRRLRDIMAAVREPARQMGRRTEAEIWFFTEDAGRCLWLQVVEHYEGGEGWIVTVSETVAARSVR